MKTNSRNYTSELQFNDDFYKVLEFFRKFGSKGVNENWHWARWEWLLGHSNLKQDMLPIIGIWEYSEDIAGIVTHDMRVGEAYIVCNPKYNHLRFEMLKYAEDNLSADGILKIASNDADIELIQLLKDNGYYKTEQTEVVLSLNCMNKVLEYSLPEGYTISCFAQDKDLKKYMRVIWKGFNHGGEPPIVDETQIRPRPHFNPFLVVFVAAPDGEYASHCGMWYDPDIKQAYVEPVVTIPKYRKLGLGKIAVYECINRCIAMGAEFAQVISDQRFYYSIGFEKSSAYTFWQKKY